MARTKPITIPLPSENRFDELTETDLLHLVAEGDESAFRELFALYAKLLFPFLAKLTGSGADAEEIIQETLLRVWVHRDELPELEKPRSWLFRIASNQAYNWLAKKASRERAVRNSSTETVTLHNQAEELISFSELKKYIRAAVLKLPPRRRLIYQLNREEGRSVQDIANELGISKSTVKNTLAEALSAIREELQKAGYSISVLLLLFLKK